MPRSPSTALACLLSASMLVLAACGQGARHGIGSGAAGATTTTGARSGSQASPLTAESAPRKAGSVPTPTTATPSRAGAPPTTTASPAPAPELPPRPVPPGTYRYDTAGSSSASGGATGSSPYPAVTTLTADPPAGSRQHTRRDLRDAHGNGPSTDEVLDYQPDGIHLVELKVTTVEAGITYQEQFDPTPPPLVLRARPKVGDHLQFTMANPTTTAKVSIDVTGTSTVAVNGTPEACIAVHALTTLSGEVSGTTTQDSCVDASYNLSLHEHVTANGQMGLTDFKTDYTATLQSLRPS